jgi:hypothetical protein
MQKPAGRCVDRLPRRRKEPILRRGSVLVAARIPELDPPLPFMIGNLDRLPVVLDEQKSRTAIASQGHTKARLLQLGLSRRTLSRHFENAREDRGMRSFCQRVSDAEGTEEPRAQRLLCDLLTHGPNHCAADCVPIGLPRMVMLSGSGRAATVYP